MFSNFSEFWVCVKEARFTFGVIWDYIVSFYYALTQNETISTIWNDFVEAIEPINTLFMSILVVICLFVALFGRKLMGIVKFSCFFVVGFAVGTHVLAPVLPPEVQIPAWLIGIVLALVAAVLYRFLYLILYITVAGYGTYILAYYGFYLNLDAVYSNSRAMVCVIAAAVAVALALVFRKYIEMIGTSILGAWCATWLFVNYVYNFMTWPVFDDRQWLAVCIPTVIISLIGACVQIKTRRRY